MLNPYGWQEHILLVGYTIHGDGQRIYGALSYYQSQEEVVADLIRRTAHGEGTICNIITTKLTEESYDLLLAPGRLPVIGE
jgi:hypothetical protein